MLEPGGLGRSWESWALGLLDLHPSVPSVPSVPSIPLSPWSDGFEALSEALRISQHIRYARMRLFVGDTDALHEVDNRVSLDAVFNT